MAALRLHDLTMRYGRTLALDGVSLDVRDGELMVLLGPSGSGKSTILKLIAGLEVQERGEIWLRNRRIDGLLPGHRDVAMVFQSYALYPHMSVFQNLAFPLESSRLGRAEIRRRVDDVAAMLGLELLLKRRPAELSGGQQQRVALGRAIVRRPQLFLLDEPLSSLDARLRAKTRLDLVRLHEQLGATMIYVTHDQVEAMTMGDRLAIIHDGVLHQVGVPRAVYDNPADLVVADFLGSPPMNLVPVEVELDADLVCFTGSGFRLATTDPRLHRLAANSNTSLVLGIRPEKVHVNHSSAAGVALDAVVYRVEQLGHETLVHLRLGAVQIAAWAEPGFAGSVGQAVKIQLDLEGVRLFEASSGRAVD